VGHLGAHLPAWSVTPIAQALNACAAAERAVQVGFWLAIGLAVATGLSLVGRRPTSRTVSSPPLPIEVPAPAMRSRNLPPYLTPVPQAELTQASR
jgi:hypothetical protein